MVLDELVVAAAEELLDIAGSSSLIILPFGATR
jgi:hypothetical protein